MSMEGNNSDLECQICLSEYSWRRRAKRLACQHTCCSACLSHLVTFRHDYVNRDRMNRPNMEQSETTGSNSLDNELGDMRLTEIDCQWREVKNNSVEVNMDNVGRRGTTEMTRTEVQILTNQREAMDQNEIGIDQAGISMDFSMPRAGQSNMTNPTDGRPSLNEIWAGPNAAVIKQKIILCPWCRCITTLANGMSVNSLPDDEEKLAAVVPMATAPLLIPEFTPVFIRLVPSSSSKYMLPASINLDGNHHRGPVRESAMLANLLSPPLDRDSRMWDVQDEGGSMDGETEVCKDRRREEEWDEMEDEEEKRSMKMWTRVCTVIILGLGIFFLICIVLHGLTCSSKPFTMITCD